MTKRRLSLLGCVVGLVTGPAAGAATPLAAQQEVLERIPAAAGGSVKIFNPAGAVRVVGWDRDTVAVSGRVAAGARWFSGGNGRDTKLGVEAADTTSFAAALEVRVPPGSRVWVRTASADVEVSGVTGEIDLHAVSGRMRVDGAPRHVNAESMDGNIEVDVAVPILRAKTASGTITVRGTPEDITATTVSGAVNVGVVGPVRRARLESVSGDLSFKGDLTPSGSLAVESHSGSVELRLPPRLAADFTVTTFGGAIESEFAHPPASRRGTGWTLAFANGAGGAEVSVRTFKGNVALKRRTQP